MFGLMIKQVMSYELPFTEITTPWTSPYIMASRNRLRRRPNVRFYCSLSTLWLTSSRPAPGKVTHCDAHKGSRFARHWTCCRNERWLTLRTYRLRHNGIPDIHQAKSSLGGGMNKLREEMASTTLVQEIRHERRYTWQEKIFHLQLSGTGRETKNVQNVSLGYYSSS